MQQRQPNPKWLSGCQPDEAKEIEKKLLENVYLFKILDKLLVDKLKTNSRERRSKDKFELPAWSEFQADCNAYERALEEVRNLLNFIKEK